MACGQKQIIYGDHFNRIALVPTERHAAKIIVATIIQPRHHNLPRRRTDSHALCISVFNAIQRQIDLEYLENHALRFKSNNAAILPDQFGKVHGMRPDIGPRFHNKHAWLDKAGQKLRLKLG